MLRIYRQPAGLRTMLALLAPSHSPPPQHLSLLNHHAVRFSLRVAYSTSTPDSGCRIEATLNHKLMFDEPCREALSLVVSMMDSDGWHELEVAVVEPLYASVCDNSVLKLAMGGCVRLSRALPQVCFALCIYRPLASGSVLRSVQLRAGHGRC